MSSIKLDAYDLRILAILQTEGRITKLKLAERIGLSPSPCWERMRRLEDAGVIRGFHADVELTKVMRTTTVFVEVTLSSHRSEDFARFEAAVQQRPEIVECWSISGGTDYLLKVITLDIERYQALIDDLLAAEIAISRYFTYIVTKRVKEQPGAPLDTLQQRAREKPMR